jgi:hypothetical protein
MKTYLKTDRGLSSAPEALVTMSIKGDIVSLQLKDIPAYLKANGLRNALPHGCTVDGVKTGAFPVIEPKTDRAALALSAVVGHPVPVGDGWSFATQGQAHDIAQALKQLGVQMDELAMEWMLGKPKGLSAPQMELALQPKERFTQAERDAAVADSPF